ncbi:MAG: rhodanese-like domain-containing protein [Candidatus Electrothrix sp. YB6]
MNRILLLIIFLFSGLTQAVAADDIRFMRTDELKEQLSSEDITILDARSEGGWQAAATKIPGAIRATQATMEKWAADLPKDRTIVVYCS